MKKQLVIVGIIVLLVCVGLSGCSTVQDIQYLTKEKIDAGTLELKIHDLINKQRQNYGLSNLQYDSNLASIARYHSEDMAVRNYFSHYNTVGQGPTERAIQAGYPVHKELGGGYYSDSIGENIALTPIGNVEGYGDVYSMNQIADCTVVNWMNSPGHRQNILTSTYEKEGIGIASSGNKVYITEDFW